LDFSQKNINEIWIIEYKIYGHKKDKKRKCLRMILKNTWKIYKRRKGESIPIKNEFHLFKKYTCSDRSHVGVGHTIKWNGYKL
jgi:hypothetical protein